MYCVKQETQGIKSHREQLIDKLGPINPEYINGEIVSEDNIEYLDIRTGNTCNFMCNFCNPWNSHLIGKEYANSHANSHADPMQIVYGPKKTHSIKIGFVNNISKYKNLKFIHFAGGEPFFMKKKLIKIIDLIQNKEQITFRVLTNTSLYDEEIIEKLKQFKTVWIMMSIDAIGRSIEISRWRSNWNILDENIQKFVKLRNDYPQVNLMMVPAIGVYTVGSLPKLLEYGSRNKIYTSVLFIQDPYSQVVNMISSNHLKKIKEKVLAKCKVFKIDRENCNYKEIIQQFDFYIKNNNINNKVIKSFWYWQKYFEDNRNYSLKKELPTVYNMIKTVS